VSNALWFLDILVAFSPGVPSIDGPSKMMEFNDGPKAAWLWTRIAVIVGVLVLAFLILVFSSVPAG
jgi:hypothetical protein